MNSIITKHNLSTCTYTLSIAKRCRQKYLSILPRSFEPLIIGDALPMQSNTSPLIFLHSQVLELPPYVFQHQEQGSSCQLEENKGAFIHSVKLL